MDQPFATLPDRCTRFIGLKRVQLTEEPPVAYEF